MRNEIEERARLAAEIGKRPSRSSQLPEGVRLAAIAYTRRRRAQGASQAEIARELGVTTMTTARWLSMSSTPKPKRPKRVPRMRSVRVVDPPAAASAIVAISREGLRIEGLTVADLIVLVRGLG
jgi:DNA-binding transcriptional regulator YiaG